MQDIPVLQTRLEQNADIVNVAYLSETENSLSSPDSTRPRYFSDIICNSPAMKIVIDKAIKIADSKYTVLIRGETGTGKDLWREQFIIQVPDVFILLSLLTAQHYQNR